MITACLRRQRIISAADGDFPERREKSRRSLHVKDNLIGTGLCLPELGCRAIIDTKIFWYREEIRLNQSYRPRPSAGKLIFGIIAALVFGVLHPFFVSFQAVFPLPGLFAMLIVALYAYAGVIPAALLACIGTAMLGLGYTPALGLAALPMYVVPAVIMIAMLRRRKPFFKQLTIGLAACAIGAAATLVLLRLLFGADMIMGVFDQIREMLAQMLPLLWETYEPLYANIGTEITYEVFSERFYDALLMMQRYCEMYLPGNLIAGATLTAMLSVAWGNWILARRGEATSESFVGLAGWNLSGNMTIGLLLVLAAGLVLRKMGIAGAEMTWIVVSMLAKQAFTVQALAAFDRRMKAGGASRARRTVMIVLLLILAGLGGTMLLGMSGYGLLAVIGCASALVGRSGVLRKWIDQNKDKFGGDDR